MQYCIEQCGIGILQSLNFSRRTFIMANITPRIDLIIINVRLNILKLIGFFSVVLGFIEPNNDYFKYLS